MIDPLRVFELDFEANLDIVRKCVRYKKRVLFPSTSEVYGDPQVHPQREDYWGHVNPIGPRGVYDEAKRFAEAITLAYHRTHQLETRIVRIFNTYGPRMQLDDGRVVPNFIGQALRGEPLTVHGEGSQTRSFTFVSDLVEGITRLFESNEILPVNIGNPNEMTILAFAQAVQRFIGTHLPIEHRPLPEDDPLVRRPDMGAAGRDHRGGPRQCGTPGSAPRGPPSGRHR